MAPKGAYKSVSSLVQMYLGLLLCMLGIVLSLYAYHVETQKESDADYTAMCDVNDQISCSKVFTSKYGRGFGLVGPLLGEESRLNVPNSIYGLLFYSLQMYLFTVFTPSASLLQVGTSFLSLVGCVYLAYILYFVLKDACIVCISTYAVNTLLFIIVVLKWRRVNGAKKKAD